MVDHLPSHIKRECQWQRLNSSSERLNQPPGCVCLFTIMLRYYCTNLTTAVLCLLQGAYVFAVPPLLVCWYRPYPQGRGRIHIPYLDFDMLFDFRELLLDLLALASHVGSATMRSASVPTSAQMPSESESESLQQLAMVVTLSV